MQKEYRGVVSAGVGMNSRALLRVGHIRFPLAMGEQAGREGKSWGQCVFHWVTLLWENHLPHPSPAWVC